MLVLALDTSTDMLAVGVADWTTTPDGASVTMLANRDHLCRRQANVELIESAQQALADCGHTMSEVTAVLVGRGPGSFTGVRIGIATAKGLACGLGCSLHGTSTLDAVAWHAWANGARGLLGVVGDAMRGEVYPGLYQVGEDGPVRQFEVESVCKADACVEAWSSRSDAASIQLTGDGLKKYLDRFVAAGMTTSLDESLWHPSSEGLLRAAASPARYDAHETGDPALVLPVYTRLSDAEENEAKRLGLGTVATVETTGCDDALADRHLQLRPMNINDVPAVAALERELFACAGHEPWSEALFAAELSQTSHSWWVAHDEGQVIGYAGGSMAGADIEVTNVCVVPDRRNQGIARRLIARVTYDAQMLGATGALLEVEDGNEPATKLYTSMGFEPCGRRRDYYGRGLDAVVMSATLPLVTPQGHDRPEPRPSVRPWPPAPREHVQETDDAIAADKLVLAIESSCDETAMSVLTDAGEVVANVVATQIDFHARFGGVVPEIASRKHTEAVVGVYEEVMAKAGEHYGCATLEPGDLSCVGVTAGPGLVGALVVGIAFAKGLACSADLTLVGANHLEGHLLANLFETPDLEPPFVASLVSGGHTMLVHVRNWGSYEVLGGTIDDAVGEAFDKVAKALGLGYPGGPVISKLAATGNPKAVRFPRAMMHSHDYSFSLSGLKTSVITYINNENKAGRAINLPDLAASFQAAVIDVQVAKAITAVEECDVTDFCVGGGVAANPQLRAAYQKAFSRMGVRVTVPPLSACTDNAAMIGLAALRRLHANLTDDMTLDAQPHMSL